MGGEGVGGVLHFHENSSVVGLKNFSHSGLSYCLKLPGSLGNNVVSRISGKPR